MKNEYKSGRMPLYKSNAENKDKEHFRAADIIMAMGFAVMALFLIASVGSDGEEVVTSNYTNAENYGVYSVFAENDGIDFDETETDGEIDLLERLKEVSFKESFQNALAEIFGVGDGE